MKSKLLMVCALLMSALLNAHSQDNNDPVKQVVSKLKDFSEAHVPEKAYLHFDKPYYAAGDTIYFKAYVTLGNRHKLSGLSGLLHVDLINTNGKADQSIKLQLINGIGWGDFTLPDSLPKGEYHIRAYTQWMRNEGVESFFDKTIAIGSALNNKIPESSTAYKSAAVSKPDLQFFPEGGELVTGITSKVAFKAIGQNGLGVQFKGVLTDNSGNEVSSFAATHLGMGYFYLKPETGKTYQAKISYADGSTDVINLPVTGTRGIALKINNDSLDKANVQIIANDDYFAANRNKHVNLLIYSGGLATTVAVKLDSALINLAILKRRLQSGITKVTLFSESGEPLSERLIFIQNPDPVNLNISTEKAIYKSRENVLFNITALTRADSAVVGHFSVAVIDESKVPVDETNESTIFNYLLLTSDLKGYIEQPNYYFTNVNDKARADLDLVMLTHGYRHFEWKQLLNEGYPPAAYLPENGLEINGIAKNAFGKPLNKGSVSLISVQKRGFTSQVTDDNGRFSFGDLMFTDSAKFVLQAVNAKGKNTTQLVYEKDKPLPALPVKTSVQTEDVNIAMTAYLESMKQQQEQAIKYGTARGIMLREVRIKQKRKEENEYRSSNLGGPGHADQVIHAATIARGGGGLSNRLVGNTRGIQWIPKMGFPGFEPVWSFDMFKRKMGLVLDGVVTNIDLDDINPSTVETVEILTGANESIYGIAGGGHGLIVVTTKQGGQDPSDIQAIGVLPITVAGFYKAREFYAPKYDHDDGNFRKADLRSTIYWDPELITGKDGKASFDYFNADSKGNYRVVIEGIDDKGNLARQVLRYKVNN